MEPDCVSTIEQAMADVQTQQTETDSRIDQILTAIAHLSQLTQSPPKITNTPKNHTKPNSFQAHPTTSPEFNGDWDKGSAF